MTEGDPGERESELLKQLLALREIPCPVCGYNLRGIESDKCPECGAKLDLRVGSSDLKLGLWIAAILGVALPLGFGLIMTLLFSYMSLKEGLPGTRRVVTLFGPCLALTILEGLALSLLWYKRKRFWRQTAHNQRQIAFMCIGASAVLAIVVIAVLMSN